MLGFARHALSRCNLLSAIAPSWGSSPLSGQRRLPLYAVAIVEFQRCFSPMWNQLGRRLTVSMKASCQQFASLRLERGGYGGPVTPDPFSCP